MSPLPSLVCCVCRVFSVDVGGGSLMLPLCTLYSVLYSVYSLLSWRAGDATPMLCDREGWDYHVRHVAGDVATCMYESTN